MEIQGEDVNKLVDAVGKLTKTVDKLDRIGNGASWGGNFNFNLNAGGLGVGISVMCVVVLLVICIFQSSDLAQLNRKYDRMQDHINAIYMMAPHLKPKEGK